MRRLESTRSQRTVTTIGLCGLGTHILVIRILNKKVTTADKKNPAGHNSAGHINQKNTQCATGTWQKYYLKPNFFGI